MTVPAPDEAKSRAASTPRSSPYQGLVPFEEADAEWFFGRDNSREVVLDSLRAYRVSILYGESGVGKSSLLQASVLIWLRQEARAGPVGGATPELLAVAFSDWSVEDPLAALKHAVSEAAREYLPAGAADAPAGGLADELGWWAEQLGCEIFVILDQLEELFLYHGSDAGGRALEDDLVAAFRRRAGAANFLLSIREDALAKLDRLQRRLPDLLDNLVRIDHLDDDAAREAIERPLEHWNSVTNSDVTIEPALVEQILVQVQAGKMLVPSVGGAGHVTATGAKRRIETPYLQLVLARIWHEERAAGSNVLRLETVERLGGAERIVRTHLDDVLDRFSWRDRKVAAVALRYLVTPSGTKIALQSEDLAAYTGVPADRLGRVLALLAGEARILRSVSDGAYEIYHDVLAAAVLDWRRRYEQRRSNGVVARTVLLAIAAVIVAITAAMYEGRVLGGLEDATVDARFSIRGNERPPDNIVIVGIDNATFAHLRMQWPFRRAVHGRLIHWIAADGAKAIAFDVQFSQASPNGEGDDVALLNAIDNARGRTVFSTSENLPNGNVAFLGSAQGTKLLLLDGSRPGQGRLPSDGAGMIRQVPYSEDGLKTLSVATVEVATNHDVPSRQFGGTSATIDYVGRRGTTPTIPYWKVFQRRFAPGTFRGKIVVVGATTPSLQDIHATPTDSAMPGVEIQANAINTIFRGVPLRRRPGVDIPLIVLLGVIVPMASLFLRPIVVAAVAVVFACGFVTGAQIAFNHDVLLAVAYPLLALILTTVAVLTWRGRTRRLT